MPVEDVERVYRHLAGGGELEPGGGFAVGIGG